MIKTFANTGDKSIGDSIKSIRESKGLTIADLSRMSGLTSATISRYENGKRIPTIENYNTIMAALGAELAVIEK